MLLCYAPLLPADQLPQLHGRSTFSGPRLTPDEAQLRWLWERQQLRLAVVRPDNPPLDVLGTGRDYEGISADYAGLLAGQLQLPVQIHVYASLNAAIEALRAREVDLLASVTARQASDAGLWLSHAYAQDLPVVVLREDEPAADVPLRVAMREGYRRLYTGIDSALNRTVCRALPVTIDQQNILAALSERESNLQCRRGLSFTAFSVADQGCRHTLNHPLDIVEISR